MFTHARPTAVNRCLATFYKPWFIFCFGVAFKDDPIEWEVAFHDMQPTPTVSRSPSGLTLHLGVNTNALPSGSWVRPGWVILFGPKVYVSGFSSTYAVPTNTFSIWIRSTDDGGSLVVFWMDPDKTLVPIPIKQEM